MKTSDFPSDLSVFVRDQLEWLTGSIMGLSEQLFAIKDLNKRLLIAEGSELNVYVYNYMHTRRSVQGASC